MNWRSMVFAVLICIGWPAHAHKPSDAYLRIEPADATSMSLTWDIALADLAIVLDLDGNSDGRLSRAEVNDRFDTIAAFATAALSISEQQRARPYRFGQMSIVQVENQPFARLHARLPRSSTQGSLAIRYSLFGALDRDHRGILTIGDQIIVLSPGGHSVEVTLSSDLHRAGLNTYRNALLAARSGIHHILIGWDHLAFLVALMMGVSVKRIGGQTSRQWAPAGSITQCLKHAAWLVSAFTLGHSVTLALAASGALVLPSRAVETVIGASVVAAALSALLSRSQSENLTLAALFGLVHGFGFASVLNIAGHSGENLVPTLLGFNIGVEIGQLAILSALLPVLWIVSRLPGLLRIAAPTAYGALLVLGAIWTIQRAFDLAILPA